MCHTKLLHTALRLANLRRSGIALAFGSVALLAPHVALAQPAPPQTTPPAVVTHVDATYPASALKERKHGDVTLAVTVDVDGHVSKVDVLSSDSPDLDEAATIAVRQWT